MDEFDPFEGGLDGRTAVAWLSDDVLRWLIRKLSTAPPERLPATVPMLRELALGMVDQRAAARVHALRMLADIGEVLEWLESLKPSDAEAHRHRDRPLRVVRDGGEG